MKSLKLIVGVLALSLAAPLVADTFRAKNKLRVVDNGDGSFAVLGPADYWARDYWCAASDYAVRVLGLSDGDMLVVARPYGRADKAVHFAPAADDAQVESVLSLARSVHVENAGLKVFQAARYCADRKLGRSG